MISRNIGHLINLPFDVVPALHSVLYFLFPSPSYFIDFFFFFFFFFDNLASFKCSYKNNAFDGSTSPIFLFTHHCLPVASDMQGISKFASLIIAKPSRPQAALLTLAHCAWSCGVDALCFVFASFPRRPAHPVFPL